MLPDRIIEEGSLVRRDGRVAVSVRIPWYRSLPLSSITGVGLAIDGQKVDHGSITWTVNGETFALDELPPRYSQWWYVLDSAVIEGDAPEISESEEHRVRVDLGLYIPYLPAGPDAFIAIAEHDVKTMAFAGGVAQ